MDAKQLHVVEIPLLASAPGERDCLEQGTSAMGSTEPIPLSGLPLYNSQPERKGKDCWCLDC